jgi:hypothetical protein
VGGRLTDGGQVEAEEFGAPLQRPGDRPRVGRVIRFPSPTINRLGEQVFEEQWDRAAKGHGLGVSSRPRRSATATRSPSMLGLTQAHRQLRLALHLRLAVYTTDSQRDIPSHLLSPVSTSASYYSPTAIAVTRTLLTKIQIFNTAASAMRTVCCGLGEVSVWRWL